MIPRGRALLGRRTALALGLAAAIVPAGTTGAAVPAATRATPPGTPTSWAGWTAVGAPVRVPGGGPAAVSGATTAAVGAPEYGEPLFAIRSPQGDRTGFLPVGPLDARGLVTSSDRGGSLAVVAPGGTGRILVVADCDVLRTDDRGATWATTTLPGCTPGYAVTTPSFADGSHGILSARGGTWTTDDAGASWVLRHPTETTAVSGVAALSPDAALRVVQDPRTGSDPPPFAQLQRTDDRGVTWSTVDLPPDPAPDALRGVRSSGDPTDLTTPVLRSDGAVLVGAHGAMLLSGDGGLTFRRIPTPAVPTLRGGPEVSPAGLVCDATARCVLGLQQPPSRARGAIRFDGDAFGAPLPLLPPDASSPAPGVIIGDMTLDGPDATSAGGVVRSDDLGATYRTLDDGLTPSEPVGSHRLLVQPVGPVLHVSADRGTSFVSIPAPPGVTVDRLDGTPDDVWAFATDRSAWRLRSGRWARVGDGLRVDAQDLAVAQGGAVVVGARGVERLVPGRRPRVVRSRALDGLHPTRVTAAGRTVVAWGGDAVVRSDDAGRTWSVVRGRAAFDDVQVIGGRLVLGLSGHALYAAVRRGPFVLRGAAPALGAWGSANPKFGSLAFSGPRTGVIVASDGIARTDDGGRTFVPQPTPESDAPRLAVPLGRGLVVQAAASAVLYRSDGRTGVAARPRISLRRVPGTPRKLEARITGAPDGTTVYLATRSRSGRESDRRTPIGTGPQALDPVTAPAGRAFGIGAPAGDVRVRLWYPGVVLPDRTIPAARSALVRIPAGR